MVKKEWAVALFFITCLSVTIMSFDRGFPFAIPTPSWAQQEQKQIRGTKDGVIVKCEMYVMGKTGEGVIISEELYRILPSTIILNTEGKKIALRELEVPSMGLVEYLMKTDNSTPTVISLQLLSESQESINKRKVGRRAKNIKEYEIK